MKNQYQFFIGQGKDDSFGLDLFQFYNWGTYDGKINEIRPNQLHSWLTGLNGAGKSTILDGLSTLLSPPAKRQYNMSSGAEKAERTEKTYVKGAWGEERDESSQLDGVKYLRGENSYSVLMARFRTSKSDRIFSLAQILWLSNDKVQKLYVTSSALLDISLDLSGFSTIKELKAKLKEKEGVRIYDSFSDYCLAFQKVFGMRSQRAVELINKTASMKEVESLTDFMRSHMLDKYDMTPAINELILHFKVAEDAHKNFQKARLQTSILAPIESNYTLYINASKKINELEEQLRNVGPYISNRLIPILNEKQDSESDKLTILEENKKNTNAKINNCNDEIKLVQQQLAGNEISHQLELLELEKNSAEKEIELIRPHLDQYNIRAKELKLKTSPSSEQFLENKRESTSILTKMSDQLKELQHQGMEFNNQYASETNAVEPLKEELAAIENRQTNIPRQNLHIRTAICDALNISEESIPFAGELIRVNDKTWESATEKLLRSFGLILLIDESLYDRVAKFANENNLRGKLEFEKINTNETYTVSNNKNEHTYIYDKIEIKSDSSFASWIKLTLYKRFSYHCCESVLQLKNVEKGITKEGLIRHSHSRHVKDDRVHMSSPANFILGWSNKEKIKLLKSELQERLSKISKLLSDINSTKEKIEKVADTKKWAESILLFETYKQIAIEPLIERIAYLEIQKKDILSKNKSVLKLKAKEESLLSKKEDLQSKFETLIGDIRSQENKIRDLSEEISERRNEVASVDRDVMKNLLHSFEKLSDELGINFSKDKPEKIKELISRKTTEEKDLLSTERNSAATSIVNAMRFFKEKFLEDSNDLLATLDFTQAYLEIYNQLLADDLPRFEREYRKMFTKDVLDRVTLLHSELYKVEAEIREAIEFINTPLESITFNPGTKIQILANASGDRTVKDFQLRLKDCLPKVAGFIDQNVQDEAYEKVKAFVDYLQSPEKERERIKVLDVRNWVEFAAEEINIVTNEVEQYYSGAAGRSGGQKAQLAFTVLASALAYQCGLTADAPSLDSFKFIMIDEAFAKTDSMKSDMALRLFKNMGFQILVSSPDRDWDIVEPHVDCVHLAYGNNERNHSQVYTISLEQASKQLDRPLGKKLELVTSGEGLLQ